MGHRGQENSDFRLISQWAFMIGFCAMLNGCTATTANRITSDHPEASSAESNEPWRLSTHASTLYSASCPASERHLPPQTITLDSTRVPGEGAGPFSDLQGVTLNGLKFLNGFALTSDDPRFGGLSGLTALEWGKLLAVTDAGDFIWINLDAKTATSPLTASISTMRGENGQPLTGKLKADAEGVAVANGLALVSFERDHRISAFDIKTCGAAAREAPVVQLESAANLPRLRENGGAEAFSLSPDGGLVVGMETSDKGDAVVSLAPPYGSANFAERIPQEENHNLTGFEVVEIGMDARLFSVHRAYSPMKGPRISLKSSPMVLKAGTWTLGPSETLLTLKRPAPVDNFEGLAAIKNPDGNIRVYMIADDNFSNNQRSLLYIFDVVDE